jgi:hypothetical protein
MATEDEPRDSDWPSQWMARFVAERSLLTDPTSRARWRSEWLARLAAERGLLIDQLLGVHEHMLLTVPVTGTWNAKDVLAHAAAWDTEYIRYFNTVLAGRGSESRPQPPEPANEVFYSERRDWPLSQVVEAAVVARTAVMSLLRTVSDQDLDLQRGLPWGDGTLRYWIGPRVHHDTEHAADLVAWRANLGAAAPARWPDRGPQALLLAGLAARREALLAYMALVPPEERATATIAGAWTLTAMAGHIADWDRLATVILEGMAARVEPATDYDFDYQSFNEKHAAARAGQPWEIAWADCIASRAALLDTIARFDDADLNTPRGGRLAGTPYQWAYMPLDHDREHADDLRRYAGHLSEG